MLGRVYVLVAERWKGLRLISANLFWMFFVQNSHKIVILRVCNFIGFAKKQLLKTNSLGASKIAKNQ
jgi:hypothetical protein